MTCDERWPFVDRKVCWDYQILGALALALLSACELLGSFATIIVFPDADEHRYRRHGQTLPNDDSSLKSNVSIIACSMPNSFSDKTRSKRIELQTASATQRLCASWVPPVLPARPRDL